MAPAVLLIELGCDRGELNEPIGLSCISEYAKSNLEADISFDFIWQKLEEREWSKVDFGRYDLIGISLQIRSYKKFVRLYDFILGSGFAGVVVVGNVIPTLLAQDLLSRHPDLVCVIGEGELAFAEILRLLSSAGDGVRGRLGSVPNLAYSCDGEVAYTSRRATPVEGLPPLDRRYAAAIVARGGIARVEASRGCHWGKCEFCSVSYRLGRGVWRPYRIDHVLGELSSLSGHGVRSPYFSDEDFFGGEYGRAHDLAEGILREKAAGHIRNDMNFFVSVLASDIKNPNGQRALLHMRQAGLREVFVGIESFSDDAMRAMKKKASPDTNRVAIDFLRANGFQVDIGSIMFAPDTKYEDLLKNYAYFDENGFFETDANIIKRLRVQPRTGFETIYGAHVSGPVDLDEVEFPYAFEDARVGRVWQRYVEWNAPRRDEAYRLQALSRGEVSSERARLVTKAALVKHRVEQFRTLGKMLMDVPP